jgi:elongation factor 2 kinase
MALDTKGSTAKSEETKKEKLIRLLKEAAAKAVAEDDPWSKHGMEKLAAERVVRHMYNPEKETWITDETIVKIEPEPFTHGAMRWCYRMKKRSPPPQSSSNHRFHRFGWNTASNYVAKCYLDSDGNLDTSDEGKQKVINDILLQYESQCWAERFNNCDPPKKIVFIRAYAVEFPDREGSPWFAVERFISGFDSYGVGFQKHNTNSGFVDEELHRYTPQCFSAHSFYQSKGTRLVADIQGVGDLYTDPQVLSDSYRFGDGDLGPRGMALFFHSFRHNMLADAMGIPDFPLSDHELKHQAKYEDDIFSMSGDSVSGDGGAGIFNEMCRFAMMDLNRSKRQSALSIPPMAILPYDRRDTEKRSNMSTRDSIRMSLSKSMHLSKPNLKRTSSEVTEVRKCLALAKEDFHFTMKQFHRKESGELKSKLRKPELQRKPSLLIRTVSEPMDICEETRLNLGRVHYQLAVLHGMNRFPETVPDDEDAPHDSFSVLFHLCHAASLHNVAACLALGRLHAGLGTSVSPLVAALVPINFDDAKDLLKRAMESEHPPSAPRVRCMNIYFAIL